MIKNCNDHILDFLNVTEKAAIACYDFIGKGDEKAADAAAVTAMREALNLLSINGRIVIGEGERDEAPMLYIGEKLGKGGIEVDIAVDPLEGTTICAHSAEGAMAVMAIANKGGLLNAPDVYMDKIAIGSGFPNDIIDLDNSPKQNLTNLAKAKKSDISELSVTILKRDRHKELIAKVREAGARIKLITDGDIAAVLATILSDKTDIYMGIGGAPEGVLAAAALKAMDGQIVGRLIFDNDAERSRANNMGISDLNYKYVTNELVKDEAIFIATGVTSGALLKGVAKSKKFVTTNSIITDSSEKLVRYINSQHNTLNERKIS